MKLLLLLPLLLGLMSPAIAHNEFNGGNEGHTDVETPETEGLSGGLSIPNDPLNDDLE